MQLQIHNLKQLQQNLKNKIQNCLLIEKKVIVMNKKLTHQGIERINKVAFRQVQIKHTSQYTVHLGCEFYVQMKADDVIQFLNRKKQKYQDDLKKIQIQLQILSKENQKFKENKNLTQQFNQKFSSTMEVIGKNQVGQDIFNIVQVEGEQEDIAKWEQQKQQEQKNQTTKSQAQKKQLQSQKSNKQKLNLIVQPQVIKQDSYENMEDEKISDSDYQDYEDDQQNQEDDFINFNRLRLQDEHYFNFKQDPQMKNIKKNIEQKQKALIQVIPIQKQKKPALPISKKEQPKKIIAQQSAKKMSKFKIQRMKERQ